MKKILIISMVLVICLLSACIGGGEGNGSKTATAPSYNGSIDGIVRAGEYDHEAEFADGNFILYWAFQDESVIFAMIVSTEGMLALGFEPETGMEDADMIIGWVKDGTASLFDCYSTGVTGPHWEDTTLNGNDDITTYAGTEYGGFTTIEFSRPLVTGDPFDKDIPTTGILNVIWAYGPMDLLTFGHTNSGGGMLKMDSIYINMD